MATHKEYPFFAGLSSFFSRCPNRTKISNFVALSIANGWGHTVYLEHGKTEGGIALTLNDLPIGQTAVISRVGGEGALRCRFLDMGLIPRTKVTVTKVAPMGDPIELRLRDYTLTIRRDDAREIEVTPLL